MDFDVAVFTNILQEKVDAFGDMARYLDTQGSLFLKLQDPNRQRAVINTDGACCWSNHTHMLGPPEAGALAARLPPHACISATVSPCICPMSAAGHRDPTANREQQHCCFWCIVVKEDFLPC